MHKAVITSENFRTVAEIYFNDPSRIETSNGICRSLSETMDADRYDIYDEMELLMNQIGYTGWFCTESRPDYDPYTPENWQSRAWMCLFMVEFLEDGTIVN